MQNQNSPSGSLLADSSLDSMMSLVGRKILMEKDDMLPAKIISWDPATNRAQIEILYHVTMTSGSMHQLSAPAEVPVQFPGGSGFILTFPLKAGSLGWIKAADRDMSLFLQSYDAQPGNTPRIHCFEDGVFIPDVMHGFTLAQGEGISIQTVDGNNAVSLTADKAVLKVGGASLTLTSGKLVSTVPFEAPNVKAGAVEMVGHVHQENDVKGNTGGAKNP